MILTDLGRRVAHPISTEDTALALREAFTHAEVFAELYAASAKGQELDTAILANRAVRSLGISAEEHDEVSPSALRAAHSPRASLRKSGQESSSSSPRRSGRRSTQAPGGRSA